MELVLIVETRRYRTIKKLMITVQLRQDNESAHKPALEINLDDSAVIVALNDYFPD